MGVDGNAGFLLSNNAPGIPGEGDANLGGPPRV